MALPVRLDGDTIPIIMKNLGLPLKGDTELHLLAGEPLPVGHRIDTTAVTNAATTAHGASDAARLTAVLTKHKGLK